MRLINAAKNELPEAAEVKIGDKIDVTTSFFDGRIPLKYATTFLTVHAVKAQKFIGVDKNGNVFEVDKQADRFEIL